MDVASDVGRRAHAMVWVAGSHGASEPPGVWMAMERSVVHAGSGGHGQLQGDSRANHHDVPSFRLNATRHRRPRTEAHDEAHPARSDIGEPARVRVRGHGRCPFTCRIDRPCTERRGRSLHGWVPRGLGTRQQRRSCLEERPPTTRIRSVPGLRGKPLVRLEGCRLETLARRRQLGQTTGVLGELSSPSVLSVHARPARLPHR